MIQQLAKLVGIGLFAAVQAAAAELPPFPEPSPTHQHYSVVGIASWYGSELYGHSTADGETFDLRSLSAAHRTMPLPSYARVTNLSNGRSIVVRVNDRGPFVGGRVLDVSARVATLLEFSRVGVARIRLDYLGKAPLAGSDGPALLASLQTGGHPAAGPAPSAPDEGKTVVARVDPAPPAARPTPDEAKTVLASFVAPAPAAGPPSPFGDLITSPFLAQAARP